MQMEMTCLNGLDGLDNNRPAFDTKLHEIKIIIIHTIG